MNISIQDENRVYKTKEDVEPLLSQVTENIYSVNLCGNVFYPDAIAALFEKLEDKKIRRLNLMRIFSTFHHDAISRGLTIISKSIDPSHLRELDLSENALSCVFTDEFKEFLGKLNRLQILRISDCGLGPIGGESLANALSQIPDKNNLMEIDLSTNKLSTSGALLGRTLSKFPNLEVIRIANNGIQKDDIEAFIRAFFEHTLRILDIRDNFLSIEGCKLLGRLYGDWDLEELCIGDCLVRDAGLEKFISGASEKINILPIFGGLDEDQPLKLDISYNEITQDVMQKLIKFVKKENIRQLVVEGNEFTDFTELKKVITEKGGILVIDSNDSDSEEIVDKLANLL